MQQTPPPYPNYTGKEPCLSTDPEAFFSEMNSRSHEATLVRICSECPMREPCAEYAIWYEAYGFWGGLTAAQRRRARRSRRIRLLSSELRQSVA